jgi:hypothetical protein
MKISARLIMAVAALALVSNNAFAAHSEVDTYYAPTGAATVAHVSGGCGGNEHTGGACFVQFDGADEVTISWEDAVVDETGYMIAFRPASGSDLRREQGCASRGTIGTFNVPEGTNRIVVFLGAVINQANNSLICTGAPQPTTGTVTATYLS